MRIFSIKGLLIFSIVCLTSCEKEVLEGDQGNQGIQGEQGKPGSGIDTFTTYFTTEPADWISVSGVELKQTKLSIPSINSQNIDDLTVYVYLMEGAENNSNGYQQALPIKNLTPKYFYFGFQVEEGGVLLTYDEGKYTSAPLGERVFKVIIGGLAL